MLEWVQVGQPKQNFLSSATPPLQIYNWYMFYSQQAEATLDYSKLIISGVI